MTKKDVSPNDIAVGKRIRKLRMEVLDIATQQEFADKLGGVTRGAVGNWERGQGIKRENLQRIAKVFRVSFEWLATGNGEPGGSIEVAPEQSSIDRMLAEFPPEFSDEADELREDFKRRIATTKRLIDVKRIQ